MSERTSTMNSRALGAAFAALLALAAGATVTSTAQAADGYYPMLCRGPLPAMNATNGMLHMRARPGQRANAPRPGECVWLDRGVNRPGEIGPDGFIRIRLSAPGLRVAVLSANGRISEIVSGNRLAVRFWRTNNLGRTFIFETRRVGNNGGYVARGLRRAARARPAPGARMAPRRGRPTVTAEPAPRAPHHPRVYARPAP